jgi:hypothetical protein
MWYPWLMIDIMTLGNSLSTITIDMYGIMEVGKRGIEKSINREYSKVKRYRKTGTHADG